MRRAGSVHLALSLTLTAAAACSPSNPAQDGGADSGAPGALTVESYNVGLAGAFIPHEAERRQAVVALLANDPSDVICVQEAWLQSDKDAIIAATRGRFPHAASFTHNLETPVTSIDPGCAVPPEATTAPCAEMEARTRMEAVLTCLAQNCSTMPGSDMGQTTSTACAEDRCFGAAAGLLVSGGPSGERCYGCIAPNLPTETFASIRTQCTTNPRAGLAFGGQSGVMILSRYPLENTEALVIPGSWNQRVIARADVVLPQGGRVGVYCNHLTPVFSGQAYPYTGRHGCGMTYEAGWTREQRAQIERLIAFVRERSGMNRALILGDFNTGPEHTQGGNVVINAEAPENFALLAGAFAQGVPQGYAPVCTFCGDNPLINSTNSVWIDHVFLHNLTQANVRSAERVYTERTVSATREGMPVMVAPSDHYGLRVVVNVTP